MSVGRVAMTEEAEEACDGMGWKHVGAADPTPDLGKLVRGSHGRWPGRDEGRVDCTDRCRHEQVRNDPILVERAEHSHLHGAEAAAPREDEGAWSTSAPHRCSALRLP